ncbi:MAG: MlrC C-terminal domain-containing protein, partial [Lachnospiraceae bacterium]|nr:MlrC C-terminal domain-containing protein [Lachnospiraceae bacterium]
LDFSIFQMQPWLNVREAGNAVTVAARTADAAVVHAKKIARKLFDLRKQMQIHLYPIDEVIDLAAANKTGTPVILVDSADSPGAGSCGDSSAVLERLLERETDLHCALCIADPRAAEHAFEVGVGNEGIFELGGTLDPTFQKTIRVKARVHLLHEGLYRNEGPAYRFIPVDSGRSAVLRIRNIDVVVVHRISYPYDVQLFRAFGVDPAMYDLVAVKSANQYKLGYGKLTSLFCPADTPGSSTADLTSLPFDRIPRPFYPFDDIEDFDDTPVSVS